MNRHVLLSILIVVLSGALVAQSASAEPRATHTVLVEFGTTTW